MADRSLTGARWELAEIEGPEVDALAHGTGLSAQAAKVLALRLVGHEKAADPEAWLAPNMDQLHDPFAMRNMEAAVGRLERALKDNQRIRVVTDYDVDGTTSSLILQAALKTVSPDVDVSYHIPSRFDEGYGFSVRAAEQAAKDGVGLIVTADIGVRDHAAVAAARNAGLDVLICDHHLPGGASVPEDALVLCPPQRGDRYPNQSLAACGVSLKLAQALLARHDKRDAILRSMLKLAAIGTVADMVSLATLENRAIVAMGLQALNEDRHAPGLQALLDVCSLPPGTIDTTALGFRVGPRINAAGRVADADLVVELLHTRDRGVAKDRAVRLDALNTERRDIQKRLVAEALAVVGDHPDPFIVVAGDEAAGWHRGVVGIAASRIKDELLRPVAVVSIQGDMAVGSVRSIPGVHAVAALDSVSDLLLKFGGHPAAAGFTIRTADIGALRERLSAFVSAGGTGVLVPLHQADVVVQAADLTERLHRELLRLGPFGLGNPAPALLVPGVVPFGVQRKGQNGGMLKFLVPRGREDAVEAVWWDAGPLADVVRDRPVDLLASFGAHTWQGQRRLQLEIRDARAA